MELVKCKHPSHREGQSCEDYAVACQPYCPCCLTDPQVFYVRPDVDPENPE